MTTCITTFSIDGYELYGRRMINTWLKNWPDNFKLVVYTEGYCLEEKNSRLIELDINDACPQLQIFKTQSQLLITDKQNKKQVNRIAKTIKWCHKVFAMNHALNNFADSYIIFLDGDTYTKKPIDSNFAEKLVDDHLFSVHFEKLANGLHFETGLISFNMNHPQMPLLKKEIVSDYVNLDIYNHAKTWDGYWFAHLYKKYKLDVLDLSNGKFRGVFTNPLVSGFLVHEAGNEKYTNSGKNFDRYSGRIK
jgi:hypothetical protein